MNSNLNLAAIAAVVSGAASAESSARDKWATAARAAYKAGVSVLMLVKGSKTEPNEQFDPVVFETLRQYIIAGVSASKKPQAYDSVRPDASGDDALGKVGKTWSFAQIVNLNKEQLRAIDDDKLRTQRRVSIQLVDGTMLGRLRGYLDRIENPEREKVGKTAKKMAANDADAPFMERLVAMLHQFNAEVLMMKGANGQTLSGVIQAQEAGLELLARIGQMK